MRKKIELIMGVVLLAAAGILAKHSAVYVQQMKVKESTTCIVVDAGHGGKDPGKVGINGELEKDINLKIAKQLEKVLEKEGIEVVLTRDSDMGLYKDTSRNKKVEDMKNRCNLIDKTDPDFTISIHQNSYPAEYVSGAQVFYFGQSKDSQKIAEIMQNNLIQNLDKTNNRTAKANESYYLLKKTKSPTVIIECGFLSNSKEAKLLSSEDYQKKVANAICKGVNEYIKEKDKK